MRPDRPLVLFLAGILILALGLTACTRNARTASGASATPPALATLTPAAGLLFTPEMDAAQTLPAPLKTRTPGVTPGATASATPGVFPTATQPFSAQLAPGESSQGWPIEAVRLGNGPTRVAVVGGIHGGYEWNTILLAYQMIDHFTENPDRLPPEITLLIIPSANPDGQVRTVGHAGRFTPDEVGLATTSGRANGSGVDLNRNWGCNWKSTAVWSTTTVDPGAVPFSEIETQILRDFLTDPPVEAVIFLHSAAAAVYAGGCGARHPLSDEIAKIYAGASGYAFHESFTGYAVSGSATDWLAAQGIPAFEVELNNHRDTDLEQNLAGLLAVLEHLEKGEQ